MATSLKRILTWQETQADGSQIYLQEETKMNSKSITQPVCSSITAHRLSSWCAYFRFR